MSIRALPPATPVALGCLVVLAGCGGGGDTDEAGEAMAGGEATATVDSACRGVTAVPADSMTSTDTGLRYLTTREGTGRAASAGDTVAVHYSGCLTDGTRFDSSRERGRPIRFVLGAGRVIQGWEEGLQGMRSGGSRILRIPPELGYGSRGGGPIPPNATLLFRVELMEVVPSGGSGPGG